MPDPVDIIVGKNVPDTQGQTTHIATGTGRGAGADFQQIQKYEKGTNRVSASKLHQIAVFLGVDISEVVRGANPTDGLVARPGLRSEAYELALHYDKLRSTAGREAVKTILSIMTGESYAEALG